MGIVNWMVIIIIIVVLMGFSGKFLPRFLFSGKLRMFLEIVLFIGIVSVFIGIVSVEFWVCEFVSVSIHLEVLDLEK